MLPRSPKTDFLARRNFKKKKKANDGSEFERAFEVQYNLRWMVVSNILELKTVQEEALLHFIKRKDVFAVLPTGSLWSFKSFREYVHICTIEASTIPKRPS